MVMYSYNVYNFQIKTQQISHKKIVAIKDNQNKHKTNIKKNDKQINIFEHKLLHK